MQSFSIVLISFILGIGLGSALISSPRCRRWPKEITTVVLLLIPSALIGLLVFHIEKLAAIYLEAQSGLGRTPMGYNFHEILAALISIGVLGLPAAALGSVLPLWIRAVPEESDLLGDHVGRLVTWNTLGAVGGVLLTGFGLMPHIGMRDSFAVLGGLLAAVGIVTALVTRRRPAPCLASRSGRGCCWRPPAGTRTGGMFSASAFFGCRTWISPIKNPRCGFMDGWHKVVHLVFYKDGADATVSV